VTEADLSRFESALSAYERVLVEISQSDRQRAWNQALQNYRALFSLVKDMGRPEYLVKRVIALFDRVLAAADEQKAALRSARAQLSKGETLFELGMEHRRRFRMEEARALWIDARKAFEVAHRTFTRERYPERWAALEVHIGDTLAWEDEGTEPHRFSQAITRYRKALSVQTSASFPAAHANTQFRLGYAYLLWADNNRNTERLERAIEAFRASLDTRKNLGAAPAWTQTHEYLTEALGLLASRKWRPPCAAVELQVEAVRALPAGASGAKQLAESLARSQKYAARNGVTPQACPKLPPSFWSEQQHSPSSKSP
jgi:tetratricopeptide (TPR) repeat protein